MREPEDLDVLLSRSRSRIASGWPSIRPESSNPPLPGPHFQSHQNRDSVGLSVDDNEIVPLWLQPSLERI